MGAHACVRRFGATRQGSNTADTTATIPIPHVRVVVPVVLVRLALKCGRRCTRHRRTVSLERRRTCEIGLRHVNIQRVGLIALFNRVPGREGGGWWRGGQVRASGRK